MTYFNKLHIIVHKLRSLKFTIRAIADIIQVGKSTVHRWLHQVIKTSKSKYSKFTKIINTAITTCLNNPFKPLKYIVNLVSKTQKISKTSLWRILRSNKIVYKKVSLVGGNPENVNQRRRDFSEIMKNKDPTEIICLDETSYYDKPIMKYGWTERGKKIFSPMVKDCNRRKTLTLAVSCGSIVCYETFQGSQTQIYLAILSQS
jgi:transposase